MLGRDVIMRCARSIVSFDVGFQRDRMRDEITAGWGGHLSAFAVTMMLR